MADTTSYVYKPLANLRSIRLFDLQPGILGEPLECSLWDYGLNDVPEYTAISYVWGDPLLEGQTVSCRGRWLDVTKTLHDALVKLRDVQRSRLLWADRICINQQDIAERSHQVKLMGEIFRSAAVVSISLGDDEEDEEKEILALIRDMVDHFGRVEDMSTWEGRKFILRDSPSRKCERNPFEGLLRLFRKPWFSRTWVIQEYGLAKTAIAMFGDQTIPFHYIGVAVLILLRSFREHLVPLQVKQSIDMVNHLYLMFSPNVQFRNFTHLIDNARLFHATDPRDKIYAFLEHPQARLSGEAVVKPDYRKSRLEVYREAAVTLIQCGQSIDILCTVQHDPNTSIIDPNFPSWVPRFDKYYGSRVLGRFTSDHLASGNNDFPLELIPNDCNLNSLTVRGIFFDTICSHYNHLLHAPAFDLTDCDNLINNPVSAIWIAGKLDTTPASYPSGDTMKKAFISALTAGTTSLGTSLDADFSAYWLRIFEARFDPEDCTEFDARYHRSLRRLAEGGSWMRFQDVVSDVCNGRKFVFTTRGYFGVGPGAMQLDDRIIVLFGADVPMVVRPRGDGRYTLVGECYIHGIMAGQVVRTWRGTFPPGVGQPYVLNDTTHSQFMGAEPLKLEMEDIELV